MVIITGVSSGIGKALVEFYLEKGESVIGIGRRNTIEDRNYTFHQCDLSNSSEVSKLKFNLSDVDHLLLVNNAGTLGEIGRISEQNELCLSEVLSINTVAPIQLSKKILQNWSKDKAISIVNISSGAAQRPIPSWASYCASKAALDMLSQTMYLEEKELGRAIKVYSVAPGVVDTPMQKQIRETDSSTFSSVDSFIQLKENNELTSPEVVAKKLDVLLNMEYDEQIIYSLRSINL